MFSVTKLVVPLLASLLAATALPSLAQAEQWGFPATPRRDAAQRPAYSPAAEQKIPLDKTSGAYLQSAGRHVADRPLACPPRRRTASKTN